MAKDETYKLGDIIRWRATQISDQYDYGMVIKEPEIVTHGVYTFTEVLIEMYDIDDDTFKMAEPLYSLTVYSFADQKVITLYKNPEDVPLFIEKVTFIEKNEKSS
tara:strand:- start:815 stop:1129 length:315 start_codon:yes stop_codon:yes gene_type:complete